MRAFLRRLAALLLPVALLAAGLLYCLGASGEFVDVSDVAQRMAAGEELRFELNYRTQATALLKYEVASLRGAQLLVLGTSRSMQFTAAMFPAADMYNAGGAISTLAQVLPFLQALPAQSLPKTLLLGLDQYFFNAAWDASTHSDAVWAPAREAVHPLEMLPRFAHHVGEGKVDFLRLLGAPAQVLGVPARVRGSGFLSDGSYRYGRQAQEGFRDATFSDSMRRIAAGADRFQYGDTVSEGALAILRELLEWCREQGISVVAYLPPYAPAVWREMMQSGHYTYMQQLYERLFAVFDIYGQECYDFSSMAAVSDEEFIDGFHAGDRVYCQMLLEMLAAGSRLGEATDAAALQALLDSGTDPRVLTVPGTV